MLKTKQYSLGFVPRYYQSGAIFLASVNYSCTKYFSLLGMSGIKFLFFIQLLGILKITFPSTCLTWLFGTICPGVETASFQECEIKKK